MRSTSLERKSVGSLLPVVLTLGVVTGAMAAEDLGISPDAVVAVDGSGAYSSIQAAIMAAPYGSYDDVWTILVRPGTYHERVQVQRERGHIRLVGVDRETTVLTHELHANMAGADGTPIGTFRTPTLQVDGDGFCVENMTIENKAGPVGQALAVRVDGDRVVFRNCRLLGWQDTLLVNRGRHYFNGCYIEGHVDFIFGGATAYFENCEIHCLGKGYITAASTPAGQPYGLVFRKCTITGASPEVATVLGRPWRPYAMTVFLETEMSGVVRPEGWDNWRDPSREKTVRYGEYGNTGPGAATDQRVPWAKQLSQEEADALTAPRVLCGEDHWNPT